MGEARDEHGRFVKGAWKGGPGRPTKAQEAKYRGIFSECIPPEKFRASCQQAWLDSVGKRLNPEGKLVDDPKSTPLTRLNAFARIASYALAKPIQPVVVDSGQGQVLDWFRGLSDDELQKIVDEAKRVLENTINNSAHEALGSSNKKPRPTMPYDSE